MISIDSRILSSGTITGRAARIPLSWLPTDAVVPILSGKLRGKRWIVGSSIHRCWMGWYEYRKQRLISHAVQPNKIFYDIGANVGFYTLLGSLLVGAGKVFAFEPLPRNLGYLRQHLALNQIHNVEVLELAVSDDDAAALFEEESTGSMGHLSGSGKIKVRTATLDSLLQQRKILPPDYIKMDIEGAELRALAGAQQCIRQYRPQIFLATHGREIHAACCRLLESWNFQCKTFELADSGMGELVATSKILIHEET